MAGFGVRGERKGGRASRDRSMSQRTYLEYFWRNLWAGKVKACASHDVIDPQPRTFLTVVHGGCIGLPLDFQLKPNVAERQSGRLAVAHAFVQWGGRGKGVGGDVKFLFLFCAARAGPGFVCAAAVRRLTWVGFSSAAFEAHDLGVEGGK